MFSYHDASRYLGVMLLLPHPNSTAECFSIDSRTLNPGECFVPLRGDHGDGHAYLRDVFKKQASGALICSDYFHQSKALVLDEANGFHNLLVVDDVKEAFIRLAQWNYERIKPKTAVVTGSVGKTSTKEFLTYLLKGKGPAFGTPGNWNNDLGTALTLSRLRPEHQYFVMEIGANHVSEIETLTRPRRHQGAVITQISPAHLEGFGSLENIYKAKLEVMDHLSPDGFLVIWDDDPKLIERARQKAGRVICAGERPDSPYRVTHIMSDGRTTSFLLNGHRFCFPSPAKFLVRNAALAVTAAVQMGIDLKDIPERWDDVKMPEGRFQTKVINDMMLIDDSYNASPKSFEQALKTFSEMKISGKKYLCISDMLELGEAAVEWHRELGRMISGYSFSKVFAYGRLSKESVHEMEASGKVGVFFDEDGLKIREELTAVLCPGDAVLFKASHGMRMDRIIREVSDKVTCGKQMEVR